jgi:outer membrane protease
METTLHTIFLISVLCFISFRANGLEFSLITDFGLQSAYVQEMVYEGEKKISMLDWDHRIIPTSSITGKLEMYDAFLKLGMKFTIPALNGTMEDYDYLLSDSPNPSNYSFHDAYLDKDFTVAIEGGYEFNIFDWFITPSIGFQYGNRKWTATDGYLQYPLAGNWTGNETKTEINGPVIGYEQAVWFPFAALEIGYIYTLGNYGKYRYSIQGSVHPFLRAETNDTNYLRSMHFYDTFNNGIGFKIVFSFEFKPTDPKGVGFILRTANERIHELTGDTTSNSTGVSSGSLIIDNGYTSKMESNLWNYTVAITIPVVY